MHLRAEAARARALAPVGRPEALVGVELGGVFGDRKRVPDGEAVVDQQGHAAARRDREQGLLERRAGLPV
jgi:hypothetical protein